MSRPVKCNKVSEAEDRESMDRISSLPDDLLGYILSFLPTKYAVGTSVLSSRWRCLHMLTNCLSFDASSRSQKMDSKAKESFKKFVNRVLMLHKVSPIKKFNLDCGRHIYDDLDLHTWISAAILKGVEQLHLRFDGPVNALPRCLFSCQNILELKLSSIEDFQVPESIYLPNLKILHLHSIEFLDADSFHKLFSACSLLQELEVALCEWPPSDTYCHLFLSSSELKRLTLECCEDHFEVDAPNLVYLQYRVGGELVALSLKNADRLVTAILDFFFADDSNSIQVVALELIKAVRHVKELQLLGDAQQYLTCFVDDRIPSYPNMVNLHLDRCTYYTWKYITHLLANSPQLDTLIFKEKLICFTSREEEWPLHVALVPFSSRVKVIEASGFRGYKSELILLKYLLGNAEALQRLTLYKNHSKMSKEQEFQAINELLTFPRASRTCAVHLRD